MAKEKITTSQNGWDKLKIITLPNEETAVIGEAVLPGEGETTQIVLSLCARVTECDEGYAVTGRVLSGRWKSMELMPMPYLEVREEEFSMITAEFPF